MIRVNALNQATISGLNLLTTRLRLYTQYLIRLSPAHSSRNLIRLISNMRLFTPVRIRITIQISFQNSH